MKTSNAVPHISVLMPVYNTQEEYLREAIESILNQTLTNFELIILNDGSTNNAEAIIYEYKEKDKRIKYYKNEQNRGIAESRNKLLELATTEYIANMDSDDISLPTRFEKQLECMEAHPDVGVCGTLYEFFGSEHQKIQAPLSNEDIKFNLICYGCVIPHSVTMIRRQILIENKIHYAPLKSAEDYDLWLQLLDKTNFINLPDTLFRYRRHDTNTTKTLSDETIETADKIKLRYQSELFPVDFSGIEKLLAKVRTKKPISSKELKEIIPVLTQLNLLVQEKFGENRIIYKSFYQDMLRLCTKDATYRRIILFSPLNQMLHIKLLYRLRRLFY